MVFLLARLGAELSFGMVSTACQRMYILVKNENMVLYMTERNGLEPLRHVGVLLAIGKHGTISAAAVAMGVTQSAITKALQRAEDDFGERLFTRNAKGAVPTEAGLAAIARAKLIRAHSMETLNAIDALRGFPGTVHIGAGSSFLDAMLPTAMAKVVTRFPAARLRLRIDNVATLWEGLRSGEIDLLFVSELPGVALMSDIEWSPLVHSEMDVVARAGHPLAQQDSTSVQELQRCGWVLGGPDDPQRSYLESLFKANGAVLPLPTIETLSRSVAIQIVQQSDLLAILPNFGTNHGDTRLTRVTCEAVSWRRVAGIAVRRNHILPPAGNELVTQIRKMCLSYRPECT